MELQQHCSSEALVGPSRSMRAEIANGITHGLGFAGSIAAATALIGAAFRRGDAVQIVGCVVYAVSLAAVYAASTLSHVVQEPSLKRRFRMWDQACIYLLIVGTYTPISLTFLRGAVGWWMLLAAMWALALVGFASKLWFAHRIESVSTGLYVALGWLPAMAVKPMLPLLPAGLSWWMLAGGVCYTIGVIFLIYDNRATFLHATWHVFVMAGSACHYVAILHYTLPPSA